MTAGRLTFGPQRIRVVVLIIVGLLLLIYAVYRVGKIFDVFASRYTLVTTVASVAGLREGAPVTLAGQRVGQVKTIDFIPVERKRGTDNLVVHLDISEEVRDQIRRDSRAYLRAQGLLGDKYVDISAGTAGNPVLGAMDTITSEATLDIEAFMARGAAVLDSASRMVADLRQISGSLVRGEGTMGQLLTNDALYARMIGVTSQLQGTLDGFNNPNGTFGRMMRDPALYNRMVSTVARVDSLGQAVMRGQGTFGKLIGSDELYRSLFGTASKADTAIGNLSATINRVTTAGGTIQKLTTDPQLYDQFLKAVVDLQNMIAEIRANPRKFVPPVQVKVF
jgi:phospholipid/cholesterol/gamma-HCH transport system substrate-binding protein